MVLADIAAAFETVKGLQWFYRLIKKVPFVDAWKEKVLNPDVSIYAQMSEYKQVGRFEYEHAQTIKLKTKKRGLCLYVTRYSWDGSEQDYDFKAFEEKAGKREKLGMVEKLPNVDTNGVKTFVIVFESNKKKELKTLIIIFEKLRDSKDIAKKESFYETLSRGGGNVTLNVSVLNKVYFFKKIVDTSGDFPHTVVDKSLNVERRDFHSWDVHNDEDVGVVKRREKYIIYWK